jgi:hypothetical protein
MNGPVGYVLRREFTAKEIKTIEFAGRWSAANLPRRIEAMISNP